MQIFSKQEVVLDDMEVQTLTLFSLNGAFINSIYVNIAAISILLTQNCFESET